MNSQAYCLNKRQAGAIDLVIICAILFGVLLIISVIRIAPAYIEYWAIQDALESVVNETAADDGKPSKKKMQRLMTNRLQVNRIDFLTADDLSFERTASSLKASVQYERRLPLIFNIDVIIKFPETVAEAAVSGG